MVSDKYVLLWVEDEDSFRESYRSHLEKAGFTLIEVKTPEEALEKLSDSELYVDMALIDMRLKDNDNKRDFSGLKLASNFDLRHIPKIVLTGHPVRLGDLRELTGFGQDDLPSVIAFVDKREGPEALIQAIRTGFTQWYRHQQWMWQLSGVKQQIDQDHATARKQVNFYQYAALSSAILGLGLIIFSVSEALKGNVSVSIAGFVSSVALEAPAVLFYSRLDKITELHYAYHRERWQIHWFQVLLSTCERLPHVREIACTQEMIKTVATIWLAPSSKKRPRDG